MTTGVRDRAVDASSQARPRALTPAEAAWIAWVPCALVVLAAIVALGRPLADLLFPPSGDVFWPELGAVVHPEPTEHAQYLLALVGPLLLFACVLAARLRAPQANPAMIRPLVWIGQLALVAFAGACVLIQHRMSYGFIYSLSRPFHRAYFTWTTLAVAVACGALLAALSNAGRVRALVVRESRARQLAAIAIAVAFTGVWLLTAINTDGSAGNANPAVHDMLPWSMDETLAITNGLTPLVTFHAQYGQLWPYLVAATLALLGTSVLAYTIVMASITGLALLAVLALLRRVTRSSLAALGLYLPFVATSFFMSHGPLQNRYHPGNLFTIFPVRYAGPFLLAWLVSRHLAGRVPRRPAALFLAAGLVAVNNVEFGTPALAATVAACVWARPPRTRRAAARLAGELASGVAGAIALVALLTLVRSGSLPHFGLLSEFSRLYGLSGWAMLPMPKLGLHVVLYLTFVAAIVLATVRALGREDDRVLTGLLAWCGVLGLGTGTYYVGRSHPDVLINLFSIWTLTLALLVVVVLRALAARERRRPAVVELAVLVAFGLAVCSIAQTPTPWSQLERLRDVTPTPEFRANAVARFIAQDTTRDERVAILNPLGHRYAHDLRLRNVSPYASVESIVTRQQLATTVRTLREAGGTKLFLTVVNTPEGVYRGLVAEGLRLSRRHGVLLEWVDAHAGG